MVLRDRHWPAIPSFELVRSVDSGSIPSLPIWGNERSEEETFW